MNLGTRQFCAVLLALTLSEAARAEKSYGPGYLRPEQIKQCLRDRKQVTASNQELTREKARLEQEAGEIEAVEIQLRRQQAEIDHDRRVLTALRAPFKGPDEQLDDRLQQVQDFKKARAQFELKLKTYNDTVRSQQHRREPHNLAVLMLNEQLTQLDQRAKAVDARCTGTKSYPEDVRAAREALAAEEAAQKR